MNQYVTGAMIRRLREEKKLTQQQLAEKLNVSDKAVSKWETGRGYPDVSLVEALDAALDVSIIELFSGADVSNTNRAFNMLRLSLHVCPVCGNLILGSGEAVVSCHGIVLPKLEAEPADEAHRVRVVKNRRRILRHARARDEQGALYLVHTGAQTRRLGNKKAVSRRRGPSPVQNKRHGAVLLLLQPPRLVHVKHAIIWPDTI